MSKESSVRRSRAQRDSGIEASVKAATDDGKVIMKGNLETSGASTTNVLDGAHTFVHPSVETHADMDRYTEFDIYKLLPTPMPDEWPRQTIIHGCVLDVEWNGGGGRLNDIVPSFESADVDIAVGHNQSEAAAALIAEEFSEQGGGA